MFDPFFEIGLLLEEVEMLGGWLIDRGGRCRHARLFDASPSVVWLKLFNVRII